MAEKKTPLFSCRGVRVRIEGKEIVRGVDLEVFPGETHALMGPNGSGKSTLAKALMGHPSYELEGEVLLDGRPLGSVLPHERARMGLFLGFQNPLEVPGVPVGTFLRAALKARRGKEIPLKEFRRDLDRGLQALGIPRGFAGRYLNEGFSGGEKKKLEILQLLLLKPRFALLDEIDSGLDIDALKVVARGIRTFMEEGERALLLVTHYRRILDYVSPGRIHVFIQGRIAKTGGPELAEALEAEGYEGIRSPLASGGEG